MKDINVLKYYDKVYQALIETPLEVIIENAYEYEKLFDNFYQGLYLIVKELVPTKPNLKNYTL